MPTGMGRLRIDPGQDCITAGGRRAIGPACGRHMHFPTPALLLPLAASNGLVPSGAAIACRVTALTANPANTAYPATFRGMVYFTIRKRRDPRCQHRENRISQELKLPRDRFCGSGAMAASRSHGCEQERQPRLDPSKSLEQSMKNLPAGGNPGESSATSSGQRGNCLRR